MELPKEWNKLHHAYLISGANLALVWQELEEGLSFKRIGNPDSYSGEYDTFGIEEARELAAWATTRPFLAGRKMAVIQASTFTFEAQSALLKLFEEPPQGTHFFVLIPNMGGLLSTLLSRTMTISLFKESEVGNKAESFLESSIPERLKIISSIIKNKDKEKARNLIKFLGKDIVKTGRLDKARKILDAEKYIGSRGASTKMILEYLAVSL